MHANFFIKSLLLIICIHSSIVTDILANNTPNFPINNTKTSIPVSFTGPDIICVGETTSLSPSTGGTWASNIPLVATVSNEGIVTGLSVGSAIFTFTETATGETGTTTPLTVYPIPNVSITGSDEICIGYTTTLSPSTGGVWSSSNPSIASANNAGIVTGIDAGTVTFTFTSTTTLCSSLPTDIITVHARPIVEITGTSMICVGEMTTLSPSTGGTWVSSDVTVATVTNVGLVTGVSPGSANFTFTSTITGCPSISTNEVTVNTIPDVNITGPAEICMGGTTNLSPSTGGTWTSSDPSVATVTNAGNVTGIAPGEANFTFTNTITDCSSISTNAVTVNTIPLVINAGPNEICIGETTLLVPITGGIWTSSNPTVATITNAGVVTGIDVGEVTFTFTSLSSLCSSLPSDIITVLNRPEVEIIGSHFICIEEMTTLSPSTGGTWTSSDPAIATVTNAGVVTGIQAGTATFTFYSSSCSSLPSDIITVSSIPEVEITGNNTICVGEMTTLSPSTGGTWTSSDPSVATVTNAGNVTGIASGNANFTFTSTITGCSSIPTNAVTVNTIPEVINTGSNQICIGETIILIPITGGIWTSSNPTVATITNAGVVTGIDVGEVTFTFTSLSTLCSSLPSDIITVLSRPEVGFIGSNFICTEETSTLSPSSGGTWSSSNPLIATVTNAGVVTGIQAGTATFTFYSASTTCSSLPSDIITVYSIPEVDITGNDNICIGETTTLSPSTGGTWTSNNPTIATITNTGIVTGVSSGETNFYFESDEQDCGISQSDNITILGSSDPNCISETTRINYKSIEVFPNPSQNVIHIKGINANTTINLISMDGKILRMKNNYNKEESIINVHQLPIGIYILQLIIEDRHIMKRISVLR